MQFFNAIVLASMALTATACKCVQDGQNDVGATETCCGTFGRRFENNDCVAGTISEDLRGFRNCCMNQDPDGELTSSCDFPGKRDEASAAVNKRAPKVKEIKSAGAIMTVVS